MTTNLRVRPTDNIAHGKGSKTPGQWVTLDGGQHVLLSGGRLKFGGGKGGEPDGKKPHQVTTLEEGMARLAEKHARKARRDGNEKLAKLYESKAAEHRAGKTGVKTTGPKTNSFHGLVAKLNAARVRRETLHGREYLVVPTTILRPDSVMNGSKGPLLYPRAEVAKNPGMWDNVPLLLNHPPEGTSGRTPQTIAKYGLGYLFNDRVTTSGARVADAWFDVDLVRKHDADLPADRRMLPRIEAGRPIDVSTGLFTEDRPVKNGVKLKDNRGRDYAGLVATNYRPDHLAVLPTAKGACSADAPAPCGTHVVGNEKTAAKIEATYNRDWPQAKRDALAAKDFAGPSQSFPISTQADVDAAAHLVGKAADPEAVKSRIKVIAKRKGLTVPEAWNVRTYSRDKEGKFAAGKSSVSAAKSTKSTGSNVAGYLAGRAVRESRAGDSVAAAKTHTEAADLHAKTSRMMADHGFHDKAELHAEAERSHRQAAKLHGATTNDEGDDMPLTPKQKTQHVARITANCACWEGKEKVLNAMDDDSLVALSSTAEQLAAQNEALDAVRETLGIDDPELVFNAEYVKSPDMKKKMQAACTEPDADDPKLKKNKKNPKVKFNAETAEVDVDESAIQAAIDEAVAEQVKNHPAVKNAERVEQRDRAALRARLTVVANLRTTPAAKKTLILNKLKDKDLDSERLDELLVLVGEPLRNARHPVSDDDGDEPADYTGAGSGYTTDNALDGADDEKTVEARTKFASDGGMTPTVNWANRVKDVMNGQRKGTTN